MKMGKKKISPAIFVYLFCFFVIWGSPVKKIFVQIPIHKDPEKSMKERISKSINHFISITK